MAEPAPVDLRTFPSAGSEPSVIMSMWQSSAVQLTSLLALSSAIFFFHLGSYGLWEPDEARYAEIAREMLASGNFVVPHLNYVVYVEKPPLLYWISAAWMAVLGANEFSA